jgi:hypothetical protein
MSDTDPDGLVDLGLEIFMTPDWMAFPNAASLRLDFWGNGPRTLSATLEGSEDVSEPQHELKHEVRRVGADMVIVAAYHQRLMAILVDAINAWQSPELETEDFFYDRELGLIIPRPRYLERAFSFDRPVREPLVFFDIIEVLFESPTKARSRAKARRRVRVAAAVGILGAIGSVGSAGSGLKGVVDLVVTTSQARLDANAAAWYSDMASDTAKGSVFTIQNALKVVGHPPGPIDGILGLQTQQAAEDFIIAAGLPYNIGIHSDVFMQALSQKAAAKLTKP